MKQKKKYVAPELTVVQFHAERGYASSVVNNLFEASQQIDMLLQNEVDHAAQQADGEFAAGYFQEGNTTGGGWVYDPNGGEGGSWF